MLHGCIELWSDCEIYGEGSKTVIKKIPAITQAVSASKGGFKKGQTTFHVADASAYTVGQDCCITLNWANSPKGAYGRIGSIDGNSITIAPYPCALPAGLSFPVNSYGDFNRDSDKVLFSSSFPVFCTYKYISTTSGTNNSVHDVYIHDLTIDGNRQSGEPCPYPLSAINLSELPYAQHDPDDYRKIAKPHKNIRIENLNIYNSPADGISIQSAEKVYITNCDIEGCGFNGIHFGVGTDIASVVGCKLHADYCGYFDCADVGSVSLTGNHFEKCPYGIGGLDQYTGGLTVSGNTFRDCLVGVCAGLTPYPTHMRYLSDRPEHLFGHMSQAATGASISNNAFYGRTETTAAGVIRKGVGISAIGGTSFVFNGNAFRNLKNAFEIGCAKYLRISNNYVYDCETAMMMVDGSDVIQRACGQHTIHSAFTDNTVQAKAVGASAGITVRRAKNMRVTGNIVIGTDADILAGDDAENVTIENNIVTSTT